LGLRRASLCPFELLGRSVEIIASSTVPGKQELNIVYIKNLSARFWQRELSIRHKSKMIYHREPFVGEAVCTPVEEISLWEYSISPEGTIRGAPQCHGELVFCTQQHIKCCGEIRGENFLEHPSKPIIKKPSTREGFITRLLIFY
ncbi:MAG: hypothetical protein PVG14_20770, partial [Anaerolineales bacterium]